MILPLDREKLRRRNQLDARQARAQARRRTTAERLAAELELAELVVELRRAAGADAPADRERALAEKSRLYVAPLRLVHRRP